MQVWEALYEARDRDLSFQSGYGHAGTGVPTGGKRKVPVGFSLDVEDFGACEFVTVPIRRSDTESQVRTGFECHASNDHRLNDQTVA